MTQPTSVGVDDNLPVVASASTAVGTLTLDTNKQYFALHNGLGNAGTAQTDAIYVYAGSATAVDSTAGAGKMILTSGNEVCFGPGVSQITFAAAGNTPTFTLTPLQNTFGRW